MRELLDVADALSTPIKGAWIAWLAWGIGQAFWYKHERASAMASKPAAAPRKAASKRQKPEQVIGRLITPQHVEAGRPQEAAPQLPASKQAPAFVPPAAPAFDPSKAIVETFDPRDRGSLDAVVADMEAHMPRLGNDAPHVH